MMSVKLKLQQIFKRLNVFRSLVPFISQQTPKRVNYTVYNKYSENSRYRYSRAKIEIALCYPIFIEAYIGLIAVKQTMRHAFTKRSRNQQRYQILLFCK